MTLFLAAPAAAGPVDGSVTQTDFGGTASVPVIGSDQPASAPILDGAQVSNPISATAGSPGAAPSPSLQAAEIIREIQAATATADLHKSAQRPGTQTARHPASTARPASGGARSGDDEGDFRQFGKSALQWLKDALPWLRNEPEDNELGGRAETDVGTLSASPLDEGNPQLLSSAAAKQRIGTAGEAHMSFGAAAPQGSNGETQRLDSESNIVREVVDFIRMLVGHPMTWLVIALFVIGGYAMSMFDRRPK
jgi:hypothetical protein